VSEDILSRLRRLEHTGETATAKDVTDAIIEIASMRLFCRGLDAKRKELADVLGIATRLMEYQEYPK
jgi:hypothetical protein